MIGERMSEVQSASLFSVSGYALGGDPAAALAGLCAADSLFHAVFKNTPVEVFYLDRQGVVRFAEGLGARTWTGQEISALFPENPQLTAALAQVWQGTSADARLTLEPFYFDAHFEPVADQFGKIEGALVTAINITEGYQYRRSLEESEQRFKTLYEHASVGVMIQALDGSLQDCNPAIQEMLNLGCGEIAGRDFFSFFLAQERAAVRQAYERLARGVINAVNMDVRIQPQGGQPLWGRLRAALVRDSHDYPAYITCMIENIHNERIHVDESNELHHRLLQGREQERLALAQELHDGPLQEIIGVTYALESLDIETLSAADREQLQSVRQTLDHLIHAVRQICAELRPPTLAPFGLEKAIRSHANTFQEKYPEVQLFLNLERDGKRLPERTRLALYRIYQESLTNVVRHAQAAHVWVWLSVGEDQVALEIQDDGAGFDLPPRWVDLVRKGHLGLAGAVERTEAIEGEISIESKPGQGTLVRVTAPIQPNHAEGNA